MRCDRGSGVVDIKHGLLRTVLGRTASAISDGEKMWIKLDQAIMHADQFSNCLVGFGRDRLRF